MMLRVRIGLLIAGIVTFAIALRTGHEPLRWVGIVLAAAALLLRFAAKR